MILSLDLPRRVAAHRLAAAVAVAFTAAALAGCAGSGGGPFASASDRAEIAAAPSVPGVPPPDNAAEAWQMRWAEALQEHHPDQVFEGVPPNPLYAIIVLEMQVDASGKVRNVRDMRTPRHAARERQLAMASVRSGGPYPAPPAQLLKGGVVRFTETWLFDNSRKFRLRSLSVPQDPNALE